MKTNGVVGIGIVLCFLVSSLIHPSDVQATTGNPLVDTVCPCNANWKNHGEYVSCVANATKTITPKENRGALVSKAAGSSCGGGDVIISSASSSVTTSGGGTVVLPDRATLIIPAGAMGDGTATVQTIESSVMNGLGPEVTTGFEFLPNLPKFRLQLTKQPTGLVQLAVAIPNLGDLLPSTHDLVTAILISEGESDEETPHPGLSAVAGEICEGNTAVCLFVLPEWFTDMTGAGLFQVQIGFGRAPNSPQPAAWHWWDQLFEFFGPASAFAADEKWHLWTLKSPTPTEDEVSPDASNLLHIGGTVELEIAGVPKLAPPLMEALQITSDFGPRSVTGNASASTWHPAVDFRAQTPLDVYPVLSGGTVTMATIQTPVRCTPKGQPAYWSDPLQKVTVLSDDRQLEVSYLHLSQILAPIGTLVGPLIGKTGTSGTCAPHLDVRMNFKDEFKSLARIDPWPLIAYNVERFVKTVGDPVVAPECQSCRELFPFKWVLYVTGRDSITPGVLSGLYVPPHKSGLFSKGEISHTLTPEEGTFDVSRIGSTITNGNYVLRLALCSGSIGGCRKVRDWKITPGSTCLDDNPNMTAKAETYADVFGLPTSTTTKIQPGPISVSISNGTASASASGTKGDVSLSASSVAGPANMGVARIEYDEIFLITSEGKTGTGQGTIHWKLTPSVTDGGEINGVIVKDGLGGHYHYDNSNGIPNLGETSLNITFTYGIPDGFNFVLIAAAPNLKDPPRSSSASVHGGYSVTVPGDPNAKITWCRAKQ